MNSNKNKNQNKNQDDKCIPYEEYIQVNSLSIAYVPFQKLCNVYDQFQSMVKGTIFPELASPYCAEDKKPIREDDNCF